VTTALALHCEGDRLHTAFLAVDYESGLVLGAALGEVRDSRAAYARCAGSALNAVRNLEAPWAVRLEEWVVAIGIDEGAWDSVRFDDPGSTALSATTRRYGQAIGRAIGPRLDTIAFRPAMTGDLDPPHGSDRLPFLRAADMKRLLDFELERHNAAILRRAPDGNLAVPSNLLGLLEAISSGDTARPRLGKEASP
jgi:hypothetical protein